MELFKPGRYYNVMGWKNLWLTVSGVLCLATIVGFFTTGLNLGTDFRGGTEIDLAFKQPVSASTISSAAKSIGFSDPQVIQVDDKAKPNRFMIRVQEVTAIDDNQLKTIHNALCFTPSPGGEFDEERCPKSLQPTELKVSPGGDRISLRYDADPDLVKIVSAMSTVEGVDLRDSADNPHLFTKDHKVEIQLKSRGDALIDGLRAKLGSDTVPDAPERVEWIGPKAGKLLRDAALKSIAISLVFIMAYIAIRFDMRFAPGAVVSLAHNVLIVLGIYIAFRLEFTLMTVASLLTLIGYSINDTVVVFDRIRENLGKHRNRSLADLVNLSVSETLSRTTLTVLTTFLVLVAYLLLGTGPIWYFSLSFSIGIIVAPYSSIFVASPVTEFVDRRIFGGSKSPGSKLPVRKRETAVV